MDNPVHGWTKLGHPVHVKTVDHMPGDTAYQRFNKRLATVVTEKVGTMTCAYVFSILAFCSLPAVLSGFSVFRHVFPSWLVAASLIALVAWVAQTYIQLVLLSVIMVGQSVQSAAADVRATKTFEDVTIILDALDLKTEGGLRDVMDKLLVIQSTLKKQSDKNV